MSGLVRALLVCDGAGPHDPEAGFIVANNEAASVMALREHAVTVRGWSTGIPPSGNARDLCPPCAARRAGSAPAVTP